MIMANKSSIDPSLAKSIKLLFSNDEDSCEQLRALLEESIRTRYGSSKAQAVANLKDDKRKNWKSLKTVFKEVPHKKLIPMINISEPSSSSTGATYEIEGSSGEQDFMTSRNTFLMEDDLCVICRKGETSSSNVMIKCLECRDLYHQDCAAPPIHGDINDPLLVWYCNICDEGTINLSSSSSDSSISELSPELPTSSNAGSNSPKRTEPSKTKSQPSSSKSSSSKFNPKNAASAMADKTFGKFNSVIRYVPKDEPSNNS